MHPNSSPLSFWTLGAQFLRLAHESSAEIVKADNTTGVLSNAPLTPDQYDQIARWSDRTVGTAVLFSYFHGIELVLKGSLADNRTKKKHHRLSLLLSDFEQAFPNTELGMAICRALPTPSPASPMSRFLASNSIQIDDWYDALKYPESKSEKAYSHIDLKYGGTETLPFWGEIYSSSAEIPAQAVALSRARGLA